MADISQLEAALVKADAAGNADDARLLAAEIRKLRSAPAPAETPKGDGGLRGSVLGGVLQSARDPLDAGAQLLSHIMPEGVRNAINSTNNFIADKTGLVSRLPEGGIDAQIAQNEQEYRQARQSAGRSGVDVARMVGGAVVTLPLASLKALQLARGKGLLDAGNVAKATTTGGIIGAAQPVTEGEFLPEKLSQIASGAAFGAASAPIGAALGRMIAPQTNPEVKALLKQGVTPTPGQILGGAMQRGEDKLMSVPLLGDAITGGRKRAQEELNRAAYARALEGTGVDAKSLPVGREGIAAVKDTLGKAYDDLLPKLSFKPDQQFTAELGNLRQMATNLAPTETRKFESILGEHMSKVSPNGSMTGETFKILESSLANEIKKFSGATDAYQRELGDALKETLNVFRQGLTRSNPQFAQELGKLNKNYANYAILRKAGSAAGDQSRGFTPSQLAAAVKGSDKSAGKGGVATGKALMQDLSDAGVNVLNSKYPDSGSIGRALMAGGLGAGVFSNPALLGAGAAALPYTPVGQRLMAALLTQRPQGAQAAGSAAQKFAPLVGASMAQPLSQ